MSTRDRTGASGERAKAGSALSGLVLALSLCLASLIVFAGSGVTATAATTSTGAAAKEKGAVAKSGAKSRAKVGTTARKRLGKARSARKLVIAGSRKARSGSAYKGKRRQLAKAKGRRVASARKRRAAERRIAQSRRSRKVRIAGRTRVGTSRRVGFVSPGKSPGRAVVARGVTWRAPSGCVPARLKTVLYQVAAKFGPVVVSSSYRSPGHNRRIGGARASWHLKCLATDFRVVGGSQAGLWGFLRSHPNVGGLKRYALGFWHIDTGPRRTW